MKVKITYDDGEEEVIFGVDEVKVETDEENSIVDEFFDEMRDDDDYS